MEESVQMKIPDEFQCPISTQLMKDPVIAGDGITYQRRSIQQWMKRSNDSPFTGAKLPHKTIIPNYALKSTIEKFTNQMPKIMKQNMIKIDLQYALKIKDEELKTFLNKIEKKTAQFENQQQKNILRINQLERQLLIERRSHSFTLKQKIELQDKCMALEIYVQELAQRLKDYQNKKIQCICMKQNQFFYNPSKMTQKKENQLQKNDFLKIQQLLRGVQRINITPNQNGYCFKKGWFLQQFVKVNKFNTNICLANESSYILSNEELPIQDEKSFYFSIKAIRIQENKYVEIGIAYTDRINQNNCNNRVSYCLYKKSPWIFSKYMNDVAPYSTDNNLKWLPNQLIVFVNKKTKKIFIIYNNQIQLQIPLTKQMRNHQYKCYAYVWVKGYSTIQFM